MRLKKADRKKYLKQIRDINDSKVVSFNRSYGFDDAEYAWFMLAWDHFDQLRLALDHIGRIPLLDQLSRDLCEPTTEDYIRHYPSDDNDFAIQRIGFEIRKAEAGLQYLRNLIIKEEYRRKKSGEYKGKEGDIWEV